MTNSNLPKLTFFCFFSLLLMNTTCDEDAPFYDDQSDICDLKTIVNKSLYDNVDTTGYNLVEAEIVDDCLLITIGASGCSGNSWEYRLVDSGAVAESSPEQRFLKFELSNSEACQAFFQKTVSFDLRPLKISGSQEIILNLENSNNPFTYSY